MIKITNGEKIKEIFPQAEITPQYVDMMLIGYDVGIDGESFFSDEWWNAEYKEPTNDDCAEQNGCISCSLDDGDDCCRKLYEESMQESTTKNDLVPRNVVKRIIESPRTKEQMLLVLEQILSITPQEPRWIPVSERLPEKDMACLVAVGKFNFTQIAVYSDLMGIIDHRIFYQGDVGHDSFKNITKYVKAWMPLPTAYREVKE